VLLRLRRTCEHSSQRRAAQHVPGARPKPGKIFARKYLQRLQRLQRALVNPQSLWLSRFFSWPLSISSAWRKRPGISAAKGEDCSSGAISLSLSSSA